MLRYQHPVHPGCIGSTENCPQVVGILQLIQKHNKRRLIPVPGNLQNILQLRILYRRHLGQHPLMADARCHGIQLAAVIKLDIDALFLGKGNNLTHGALR